MNRLARSGQNEAWAVKDVNINLIVKIAKILLFIDNQMNSENNYLK
jgi:hypothetical protein